MEALLIARLLDSTKKILYLSLITWEPLLISVSLSSPQMASLNDVPILNVAIEK